MYGSLATGMSIVVMGQMLIRDELCTNKGMDVRQLEQVLISCKRLLFIITWKCCQFSEKLMLIVIPLINTDIVIKMLLKWQALILNSIYSTTKFESIIVKSTNLQAIDYSNPLHIYQQLTSKEHLKIPSDHLNIDNFLKCVHTLCKGENLEQKKENILICNKLVPEFNKVEHKEHEDTLSYNIFHVILFSGLSKCTIWPAMYKTSKALVPELINFYNNFFQHFQQYLDYKFDPLILSNKYTKLVKNIKQKRLAHPELFNAVEKSDTMKIREIVDHSQVGILNQSMQKGLHVCHVAAIHSNLETLKVLYELKTDFELFDDEEQTAIFYAVKRFDLQIIRFLVEEVKVNINHTQYQNRTPIYLAAFEGNLTIVDYLYKHGANPQIQSKLNRTPLSKACYLDNVEVAKYLINLGVNIESTDSKGRTALHNAAWGIKGGRQGKRRGHIKLEDSPQCVEMLIKAGHRVDFEDLDKFTPLFSAISSHAQRSLRLLVKHGANLKHKTIKGQTAVFIACKYGHLTILKILIEQFKCDYLQPTSQGYTPLMASLTQQSSDCFKYMLNVYLQNKIQFGVSKVLIECLSEFNKWQNLIYLNDWLEDKNQDISFEEKGLFMAGAIDRHIEQILEFTFGSRDQNKIKIIVSLVQSVQKYLNPQTMQTLLLWVEKQQWFSDTTLKMLLNQHKKGLKMPHLQIYEHISQEVLIDVLQVDSNLTASPLALYTTLISLVRLRLSKVIIEIMNLPDLTDQQSKQQGVARYNKKQLFAVIYSKMEGHISLVDYCLVNGYFDMYKLICSFYNENYQCAQIPLERRPSIPRYYYRTVDLPAPKKCFLFPIENPKQLLNLKYLFEKILTEKEQILYKKVRDDIKELDFHPQMVSSMHQLEAMKNHIEERNLIGIDIEHYSSSSENFICLIQIATLEQVFLIDCFNHIRQEVDHFLRQLFSHPQKIKVIHSYDNDLKWISQDYSVKEFKNVLDTARIFTLSDEHHKSHTPSLKWLAEHYLNFQINKEYQQSDWRIRPLFPQMALYAATDAKILPYLLLTMLETLQPDQKKGHCIELLKYMESKRAIKNIQRCNIVKMI